MGPVESAADFENDWSVDGDAGSLDFAADEQAMRLSSTDGGVTAASMNLTSVLEATRRRLSTATDFNSLYKAFQFYAKINARDLDGSDKCSFEASVDGGETWTDPAVVTAGADDADPQAPTYDGVEGTLVVPASDVGGDLLLRVVLDRPTGAPPAGAASCNVLFASILGLDTTTTSTTVVTTATTTAPATPDNRVTDPPPVIDPVDPDNSLAWWIILLIVLAAVAVVTIIVVVPIMLSKKREDEKKKASEPQTPLTPSSRPRRTVRTPTGRTHGHFSREQPATSNESNYTSEDDAAVRAAYDLERQSAPQTREMLDEFRQTVDESTNVRRQSNEDADLDTSEDSRYTFDGYNIELEEVELQDKTENNNGGGGGGGSNENERASSPAAEALVSSIAASEAKQNQNQNHASLAPALWVEDTEEAVDFLATNNLSRSASVRKSAKRLDDLLATPEGQQQLHDLAEEHYNGDLKKARSLMEVQLREQVDSTEESVESLFGPDDDDDDLYPFVAGGVEFMDEE